MEIYGRLISATHYLFIYIINSLHEIHIKMTNKEIKTKQVAQLSQGDRAGLVMAKSGRMELGDNVYGHVGHSRSSFNHCDVIGLQSYRIL